MRLREYAKKLNVTYRTAYNHFKEGLIKGYQLPTGTIIIEDTLPTTSDKKETVKKPLILSCVLYARVSSSENKDNLETQLKRLNEYVVEKGYKVVKEISETGSGINDKRKKLLTLLSSNLQYDIIVVEHKDRFARFGTALIEALLTKIDKRLEIINNPVTDKEDITQDLISILTSYSAKIYGLRRAKRKTFFVLNDKHQKLKHYRTISEDIDSDSEQE
jgi:predicted site-specific integrase-resolvase